MEPMLREEYQKLYGLDDIQAEVIPFQSIDNVVRVIQSLNADSTYEFFEILHDANLQGAYYALEAICAAEHADVSVLRALLPFTFMRLVGKLSETKYATKIAGELQTNYKSMMGSKIRMPLRFTTAGFKKSLFSGALKADIENGNLLDIGVDRELPLKTDQRLQEMLAIDNFRVQHLAVNYFSRYHIPFDFVAAVVAVLKSQVKKGVLLPCI